MIGCMSSTTTDTVGHLFRLVLNLLLFSRTVYDIAYVEQQLLSLSVPLFFLPLTKEEIYVFARVRLSVCL